MGSSRVHALSLQSCGFLSTFGFTSCAVDPTVLIKKAHDGLIILAVYVDDILLTGSDDTSIHATKTYLQQ